MIVRFSKEFEKALDKLSGKIHGSVVQAINDVIGMDSILGILKEEGMCPRAIRPVGVAE